MIDREVLISNVFADANKGGATITWATIDAVRAAFPGSDIGLIPVQVKLDDIPQSHGLTLGRYPDVELLTPFGAPKGGPLAGARAVGRSVPPLWIRSVRRDALWNRIGRARAVVSKGGYVFVDRKSVRDLQSFWLTTLPLIAAVRSGVPAIAIGATVGPFENPAARRLVGFVLRQLDAVVVRDELSEREALRLGVHRDRLFCTPDVVFGYRPLAETAFERIRTDLGIGNDKYGVVTLAVGDANKNFHAVLRSTLIRVLNSGRLDRVYLPLQSLQDRAVTDEFCRITNDPRVVQIQGDLSPDELMALYHGADISIARRMHAAIFSLLVNTPTLACAKYGFKVQGVMGNLGLSDFVVQYPHIDEAQLERQIRDVLGNADDVKKRVRAAVRDARERLEPLPGIIRDTIGRNE